MKKYINISLLALVALASLSLGSCKNEVDEIFDDDAVARLAKAQAEYVDILTSQGGRWQLQYYANANEQGYVYVMTFDKNGSVVISGMNQWIAMSMGQSSMGKVTPAYGSATSLWDVITDNGPVLSFNSYNPYFHLFADPYDIPSIGSSSGLDGSSSDTNESGYGHEGDYEFDIMKYSGDTLYLTGKKYNLNMIMVRIPEAGYPGDEVYMNEVTAMADSFFNAKIQEAYVNLPNGTRWVVKNGSTSILKMFREGDDEISTAENHNVIITHDGLSFMNPLVLDGVTIQNFLLQPDGSLLCREDMTTTMTADDLSKVITKPTSVWRLDLSDMTGHFAELFNKMVDELNDYQTRKLQYVELAYIPADNRYSVKFNVKRSTNRFNPTYYITMEQNGDTKVNVTVAAEGDKTGQSYAERIPSMRALVDALAGEINLTANSLLSPTNIHFNNANGYITWVMQ